MNRFAFIYFLAFLFFGCSQNEILEGDCLDNFLDEREMVRYTGQDFECKFFLTLYEYRGKQYYLLGNNCVDMIAFPTACDGEQLCKENANRNCDNFYDKAICWGVVGIDE